MRITRNLWVAALLATAGNAVAASSVDLSVKGTITPSACALALGNGGSADFGKLSAKDLRPDKHTYLRQNLPMSVTCEAATLFALTVKDNREGSESDNDYFKFGLGLINGSEKLGYLTASVGAALADDVYVRGIGSWDGGATWEGEPGLMENGLTSFAKSGTFVPIPMQRLVADLQVLAAIAPAQGLTLTSEVPLDGFVTLTVVYL